MLTRLRQILTQVIRLLEAIRLSKRKTSKKTKKNEIYRLMNRNYSLVELLLVGKVWTFWEGHKIWKNLPLKIWRYWVMSNFKWKIFSNFVAFSECLNFKRPCFSNNFSLFQLKSIKEVANLKKVAHSFKLDLNFSPVLA